MTRQQCAGAGSPTVYLGGQANLIAEFTPRVDGLGRGCHREKACCVPSCITYVGQAMMDVGIEGLNRSRIFVGPSFYRRHLNGSWNIPSMMWLVDAAYGGRRFGRDNFIATVLAWFINTSII